MRGLPPSALVALLRELGGPAAILGATRARLAAVVPDAIAARAAAPAPADALARTTAWLAQPGNKILAWGDPGYPKALLEIGHAPPVLYFVGRTELLREPAFAIVGSRSATAQGKDNARAFARALADAGLVVVSGLALGIDGAAHEGALAGQASTLAVVGTGLDRVYPARHRALAHAIAERGGLVSEFPPGTPPREQNFPRRNRLISGLARGVLVVEAALHSGSLITARYAGEQGREVFAIPGSIHSPLSKGCHKLIREGAKLVETAQDVLEELGLAAPAGLQSGASAPMSDSAVLAALGSDPADVDTLIARTGLPAEAVIAELTELEIGGDITSLPGGKWLRRPA
ncbi:MAG: DNA-protecting protein DprA [Burkholderiales bacterium]|nr:DNA-protecting protein DprA [Burkholderiales bacterium]